MDLCPEGLAAKHSALSLSLSLSQSRLVNINQLNS